MSSDLFIGIVIGAILAYLTFALVLPDSWSTWIALRKNIPLVVLPLAILATLAGIVIFLWALWDPFITALSTLEFAPWIWMLLIGGIVVTLLSGFLVLMRIRAPAPVTTPSP